MERTADWPRVYLDTSAFIYFAKAGHCMTLVNYLGKKLRISTDVETELGRSHHPDIELLMLVNNWPPGGAQELPPHLTDEARRIIQFSQEPGDRADKNAGEVTTVMCAQHDGRALVILEDNLGKRQAKRRGVKRLSTAQLAAEMVAVGALSEQDGCAVFEKCIEDKRKVQQYWRATLRDAREAQRAS
jgi:hypothetical protein